MSTQSALSQYSIDFTQKRPPAVQEAIAEGMQAAYDHADKFWKPVFAACIQNAAMRKPELTVDDVLDELEIINATRKERGLELVTTHHMCAIGPAMSRACKDGLISPTNRTIRSTRVVKHGNRHVVWMSNHFRKSIG